ncbi:hypothetical protein B0H17DRAFT_1196371 [Mycena rosella]|uniref:Uncharacterized protein n=1 Tax=Mycena rosella TaxID=1033263 RepID=A0AAD7DUC0_MYCRO|nr:hypothetical protein B0H17DRAFT_1196371 [Mycena rosella]
MRRAREARASRAHGVLSAGPRDDLVAHRRRTRIVFVDGRQSPKRAVPIVCPTALWDRLAYRDAFGGRIFRIAHDIKTTDRDRDLALLRGGAATSVELAVQGRMGAGGGSAMPPASFDAGPGPSGAVEGEEASRREPAAPRCIRDSCRVPPPARAAASAPEHQVAAQPDQADAQSLGNAEPDPGTEIAGGDQEVICTERYCARLMGRAIISEQLLIHWFGDELRWRASSPQLPLYERAIYTYSPHRVSAVLPSNEGARAPAPLNPQPKPRVRSIAPPR